MIRLNVFLEVNDENKERVLNAGKELTSESKHEEGCIAYDVFQSATRDNVLMICETWKDEDALAKHQNSEHFKRLSLVLHEAKSKTEKFAF